ncbi:nuclear transport factor 2 family protein [Niveispirillum irakense]|uniref:nuclear transport factor 2 family protein n=1 Tax=Niveispirillum irakense TaxID=34011 RepID=UPI0004277AF5|nr:nuclear transport factor 2 family protein [Niveispirillum irakense]
MVEVCWPDGVPALMPAEDRAEITELFARYAWGLDLADEEQVLDTFAEDGEFDHLWQGKAQGRDAIRAHLRGLWYDRQHWWFGRQHLFNHFIMDPRPEGARVRCFFQIIQFNADYGTNFIFGIGTRDDRLVKRNGSWKFHRLFVNAWTKADQVPWKGERTMVPRPFNTPAPVDCRPFSVQSQDPW